MLENLCFGRLTLDRLRELRLVAGGRNTSACTAALLTVAATALRTRCMASTSLIATLAAFLACLNSFLAVLNFNLATRTSTRADLALDSASAAFVDSSQSLRASVMRLAFFFITSKDY